MSFLERHRLRTVGLASETELRIQSGETRDDVLEWNWIRRKARLRRIDGILRVVMSISSSSILNLKITTTRTCVRIIWKLISHRKVRDAVCHYVVYVSFGTQNLSVKDQCTWRSQDEFRDVLALNWRETADETPDTGESYDVFYICDAHKKSGAMKWIHDFRRSGYNCFSSPDCFVAVREISTLLLSRSSSYSYTRDRRAVDYDSDQSSVSSDKIVRRSSNPMRKWVDNRSGLLWDSSPDFLLIKFLDWRRFFLDESHLKMIESGNFLGYEKDWIDNECSLCTFRYLLR